ncbi:MAG: sulfatase [Planctomycetes bacterium]|nr:sulfatase [Planctomycetota bacterium]
MRYLCLLLAFLPLLSASAAAEEAEPDRPNVIVIYADDLGYGDLGCYGHPEFTTPNLDRMAAEGARLTQFYSSCPYCAPSRGSLMTGRYPFRHGVTRNPTPDAGINNVGIAESEITLGEAFQQADYATACIGKWHLGHKPEFFPRRHGFDEYFGILYSNDMRPVQLMENDEIAEDPVEQSTLTLRYTDRAIGFLERNQKKPFLLYLPHAMPHKPLAASRAFYKKSGAGLYGDVIAELDHEIGRLLKHVKELGLDERTLVIFTSDNGPWYGGSTGGLRGMKGQCWEGGIRVPLIARWPGKIPPGHVNDSPAIIMDVFATALAAAGIPLPEDRVIDGRDLMPLFTSDASSPHLELFSMRGAEPETIRVGNWKLHRGPSPRPRNLDDSWVDPRGPDGETILAPLEQARPSEFPGVRTGDTSRGPLLFDLQTDPAEQVNLADRRPEIVEALMKRLQEAPTKP